MKPAAWNRSREAGSKTEREILIWLVALLAAVVLEGALRKWVVPRTLHPVCYVAKDIVAVLMLLRWTKWKGNRASRLVRLGGYASAVLLFVPFIVGLTGGGISAITTYKNAFLWALLAALLAGYARGWPVAQFTRVLGVTSLLMAILALIQFQSPPNSWINVIGWRGYAETSGGVGFGEGDRVRATGTFTYMSGLGAFAAFSFLYAVWRYLSSALREERVWSLLCAGGAACCAFATGSRSSTLAVFLGSAGAMLLAQRASGKLKLAISSIAVGGIVVLLTPGGTALQAVMGRFEHSNDTVIGRATGDGLRGNLAAMIAEKPLGDGLGKLTGYNAARIAMGEAPGTDSGLDDGTGRLVQEAGVLGLLALWVVTGCVWYAAIREFRSNDYSARVATCLLGLHSSYWISYGTWHDHNVTAFTWLGVLFWLGSVSDVSRRSASRTSSQRIGAAAGTAGLTGTEPRRGTAVR